jgi:hypothetical protein
MTSVSEQGLFRMSPPAMELARVREALDDSHWEEDDEDDNNNNNNNNDDDDNDDVENQQVEQSRLAALQRSPSHLSHLTKERPSGPGRAPSRRACTLFYIVLLIYLLNSLSLSLVFCFCRGRL